MLGSLLIGVLALLLGLLLVWSARRFRVEGDPMADRINA